MTLSLEEALAHVPHWVGLTNLKTTLLIDGITNQNYRIDVGGESFVLRIAGANTELLGIDRHNEYAAHQAAATLGVAPEILHFIEPEGYIVSRFIAGQPVPPEEMAQAERLRQVAAILRRVHAMPAIPGTFSPFHVVEDYNQTARRYGVAFPENFDWLLARMREIEAAFLQDPFTPCPCHNDLLNANFLDDGQIWILDWEYAGLGDRFFDLANFSVNHSFSDEQDHGLLEAYFGAATPARLARLKLMKIMSDFREAMWGMVQIGISQLDFDFREYADKHFKRMTENFNDPRCARWLQEVTQGV
ncbi:MAG: phosphotransferase [Chloroflexi bacterium]|nr:phosphotransferase [Chloroflexota bacterium]